MSTRTRTVMRKAAPSRILPPRTVLAILLIPIGTFGAPAEARGDSLPVDLRHGTDSKASIVEVLGWSASKTTSVIFQTAEGGEFTASISSANLEAGSFTGSTSAENGRFRTCATAPEAGEFFAKYGADLWESENATKAVPRSAGDPRTRLRDTLHYSARPPRSRLSYSPIRWVCSKFQDKLASNCRESCRKTCGSTGVEDCSFQGTCGLLGDCIAKCKPRDAKASRDAVSR